MANQVDVAHVDARARAMRSRRRPELTRFQTALCVQAVLTRKAAVMRVTAFFAEKLTQRVALSAQGAAS